MAVMRFPLPALTALCAVLASAATSPTPVWTVFETSTESVKDYANPLQEVDVEVEFGGPQGSQTTVPAFWDGGRTWRVRFSPSQPGQWSYRWRASDSSNEGLNGPSGSFDASAYEGDNPLYQHGAVSVAEGGRHFAHADGVPFFWLGDTAWNGVMLSHKDDWDYYLSKRKAQSFSVIQFVALPWRSAVGNEFGRPAFYGREKVSIEPNYFQRMDERVAAINAHGLVAAPVMFWTHSAHIDLNPGMFLPEKDLVKVGRYMIARYGAYHVMWILGGDGQYVDDRAKRWRHVGEELFGKKAPGIRRPVTVHAGYWCADAFEDEDWWDFNGYQSGHVRERGLERITHGEPTTWWRQHQQPVLNLEPNYEAHRNRAPNAALDDVFTAYDVRKAAWYSVLAGPPAGVTYGAHGVWGWHPRPEEPMTHPGTGLGAAWRDALELPGGDDMRLLAEFFSRIDWPALRPFQQALAVQPGDADPSQWIAIAKSDKFVIAYLPSGGTLQFQADTLPAVKTGSWYSPRTGEVVRLDPLKGSLEAPSTLDWVLVLGFAGN